MNAKIGRPTNNPKDERITVRLDSDCTQILDEYCEKNNLKRAEAIREGIRGLKNK